MSFQPVLPLSGYAGWNFLSRTLERQQEAFAKSSNVTQADAYFRENIAKAKTPDDLLNDRRLLEVSLKAFGLEDDINSKAFLRKILEGGTINSDSLANRLSDKRYAQFAFVFGYGNLGARVGLRNFSDEILSQFKTKSFEAAVGAQDDSMRMALNFDGAMSTITKTNSSDRAQWFTMMGDAPLRKMFETALGLPVSFGVLDIDRQLVEFKSRAQSTFGTDKLADLATPENREKMIRLFMIRQDIAAGATGYSSGQMALTLLQNISG